MGMCWETVIDMKKTMPEGMSFSCKQIRDPFVMAVLLEDVAATTGVLVAIGGIGMTSLTDIQHSTRLHPLVSAACLEVLLFT